MLKKLIQHCCETKSIWIQTRRMTCVLWSWSQVLCLCLCSPSEQSDGGAVCFRDGVASEHRPGQKIHLALLGKRPAAGDVPHCCLGHRATVSFTAFTCRLLRVGFTAAQLPAKWSEASLPKWEVMSHLWCCGLWDHAFFKNCYYYDNAACFKATSGWQRLASAKDEQ